MRLTLSLFGIILFWSLSISTCLTSCTKDKTMFDTVTVTKNDTVNITKNDTLDVGDTLVTNEILTSHPWKLQELRGVSGGTILYYLRGGSANTTSYDNEYYVFDNNQTGYEYDNIGITRQLTNWTLTGDQIIRLTFTYYIDPGTTMIITWDNLRFKNNALYYDEYYSNPSTDVNWHGQGIRIAQNG